MADEEFKRRLTAILSADVEGYSRLMREDEEATIRTITTYRTAMTHLIQQYRGRVVDSPGDNILAEFTSVVDAVNCGVEIQRELAERNAELPENRRMRFRIGINLGDILEEGERIYGDGVNIAARMETLAEAGEICISGTVYDAVESKIGLEYEYLGEHEVKNIDKPIRAYRVLSYPGAAAHRVAKAKKAVGKTWRNTIIAIVAVLIVGAAVAVWHFYFRPPPIEPASVDEMAYPLPENPSIAVLPFKNLSGDQEQEYLADGFTENIITALSKTPKMFVIASNSVFIYKNKPVKVQQVAEEMGVRYVLEGSLQRSGDQLRINAQLIDALKGHHLWAERYDRQIEDTFVIQDEIAIKIITALQVELTEGEQANMLARGTKNLEAFLKANKALYHYLRFTQDDNARCRKLAQEVIALDPTYHSGYGTLAWTHLFDLCSGWSKSPKKSMERALELTKKVQALGEHEGAHFLFGKIYILLEQHEKAIHELKKALDFPGSYSADIHALLAQALIFADRPEEGIECVNKAIRLNPMYPSWYVRELGRGYLLAGKYQEAIQTYRRVLGMEDIAIFSSAAHAGLAIAYAALDRDKEARAHVAEMLQLDSNASVEGARKILPYKNPADVERIITLLRKAGLPEHPPVEPASIDNMAFPLPDDPSIAVLPFDNLSGDPNMVYFCDGLAEEIITALSNLPGMFVIARNSSFVYKGRPVKIKQVAEDLGVRYVLEGSFRKSGEKVRITAQLIDATTGRHLWADRYDGELVDIFDLQDKITQKIITSLDVELLDGEQARAWRKSMDPKVYEKWRQALETYWKFTPEDNHKAREMLNELIALYPDQNHLGIYVILGWTYVMEMWFGWSDSPEKSLSKAVEFAQKGLEIDESAAGANGLMSWTYLMKRDYDKAVEWGKRAVTLCPNSSQNIADYAFILNCVGRRKEAISLYEKAMRLDPLPPVNQLAGLGYCYSDVGRYDDAIRIYKRALKISPKHFGPNIGLIVAYSLSGRVSEAKATAEKILKINPNLSLQDFEKMLLYKNPADKERVINALRNAGLPEHPPLPLPDKPSIAVLPFANISGDPEQDYLSDGITENIITALSKIPEMLVIARNSVFTYKGKPVKVRQVGKELGVRYVLEGSMQKSGDRLRITAQLIDAKTEHHLWSESYDRDLEDLFELQDDIAKNVITALQVELTSGQAASLLSKGTTNLKSYLKMMEGGYYVVRFTRNDNETARRLYEEAIELDPAYANAYVSLAWTYSHDVELGWTKASGKSYEKAIELAKKAIDLDEKNAYAYTLLASVYARTGEYEKAGEARKIALSLDPNNSLVNALSGKALFDAGRFKRAITLIEKTIRINPKHGAWVLSFLGSSHHLTGQNEKAIGIFRKLISREPENPYAHAFLGLVYNSAGRPEDAVKMLEKAFSLKPDLPSWFVGCLAFARCGTGKAKEALTTMQDLVSHHPDDTDACRWFSMVMSHEGRHEQALQLAKEAVRLMEKNPPLAPATFYHVLAAAYFKDGQYKDAIVASREAIRLWPDYIYGHIYLTASYSLAGRMDEARGEAKEVLRINPEITLEDIAKNNHLTYYRINDKERIINALRKAGLK